MWIDVATKDIRDDIDYDELEKLFAAETHENKKANVGGFGVHALSTFNRDIFF